ncbi:MAG: hypothetical protein ABEH86_09080 [Haloarcula sp.]
MSQVTTIVAVLLVVLSLVAIPIASAHTNYVSADPQHSVDGTITAELVYTLSDSWLVVHRDDNGSVGEPTGHTLVRAAGGFKTNKSVSVNHSVWRNWSGTQMVHLVLHNADGDGQFDPADDPILTTGGDPVSSRIAVERSDKRATIGAEGFSPATTNGTVTIRTVQVPTDSLVVLHKDSANSTAVGEISLAEGTHHNTTITLDDPFYRSQNDRFRMTAVLYRDDGDGAFESGDSPIRAGDELVATTIHLTPSDTSTPTPTPSETQTDDGHDHDHGTATSESATPTTSSGDALEQTQTNTTTDTTGPGFGIVLSVIAISIGLLLWRRQER